MFKNCNAYKQLFIMYIKFNVSKSNNNYLKLYKIFYLYSLTNYSSSF